ncbi:hypothetical protein ACHAO4_005299 [Trichoderma viride]
MFKSALLLALATAVTARKCQDLTIPISISATNTAFNLPPPATDIDVANILINLAEDSTNFFSSILVGPKNVSGHYSIGATYCQPDHGPGKALQILTHGAGFDRSYWDLSFNHYNYSYVARAVDEQGYSTFSWDRLGISASSKGDPVNEIQQPLEAAALEKLSMLLRDGSVHGINAKFDKFIHVGHSFGSALTYGFIHANPDFSDAAILTGFSQIPNFVTGFLLGGNYGPVKDNAALAAKYPCGYITPKTSIGVQIDFFAPGDFDPKMLANTFAIGQPSAIGEFLTLGATAANDFKGHLLIITGDRDLPFCGGSCYDTTPIQGAFPNLLDASKPNFPSVASFNTTIVPGGGHGLNMGYSHKFTYDSMFNFLSSY